MRGKEALERRLPELEAARDLADEAAARGRILQVGHQERFVAKAMGVLAIEETPLLVESVRAGPPAADNRAGDVSVIWDLMIHDLDLAAMMFGNEFTGVAATGKRVHSDHLDEATAEFTYANGGIARLIASRASTERQRSMHVVYPSGEISIDFLTRKVKNSTPYEIKVESCPNVFKDSALEAAHQWKFYPMKDADKPIRSQFVLTITFKLR